MKSHAKDSNATSCPICGTGKMLAKENVEQLQYRESPIHVSLRYSECENCGTEVTAPEHARANDFAIREEYKRVEGLLSGAQVKAIRGRLNLTQKEASQVFGGGSNSFAKYETERVVQSKSLDLLLRLASERPNLIESLERFRNYTDIAEIEQVLGGATYLHVQVKNSRLVTRTGSASNASYFAHETLLAPQRRSYATAESTSGMTPPTDPTRNMSYTDAEVYSVNIVNDPTATIS